MIIHALSPWYRIMFLKPLTSLEKLCSKSLHITHSTKGAFTWDFGPDCASEVDPGSLWGNSCVPGFPSTSGRGFGRRRSGCYWWWTRCTTPIPAWHKEKFCVKICFAWNSFLIEAYFKFCSFRSRHGPSSCTWLYPTETLAWMEVLSVKTWSNKMIEASNKLQKPAITPPLQDITVLSF